MRKNPYKIELPLNDNNFRIVRENFKPDQFFDIVLGVKVCGIVLDFKSINGLNVASIHATKRQIELYNEIHPMHLREFISLYKNTGLKPLTENQ